MGTTCNLTSWRGQGFIYKNSDNVNSKDCYECNPYKVYANYYHVPVSTQNHIQRNKTRQKTTIQSNSNFYSNFQENDKGRNSLLIDNFLKILWGLHSFSICRSNSNKFSFLSVSHPKFVLYNWFCHLSSRACLSPSKPQFFRHVYL